MEVKASRVIAVTVTIVFMAMLTANWYTLSYMDQTGRKLGSVTANVIPSMWHGTHVQKMLDQHRIGEILRVHAPTVEERGRLTVYLDSIEATVYAEVEELERYVYGSRQQKAFHELRRNLDAYMAVDERVEAKLSSGDPEKAERLLFGESRALYEALSESSSEFVEASITKANILQKNADEQYDIARTLSWTIIILAVVTTAVWTIFTLRFFQKL